MSEFVPVSQGSLLGAVPAMLGGAGTLEGLANARPRSAAEFVPAQSFVAWQPTPSDDAKLPCAHPTKKGKVCQMARAYETVGDAQRLTPYCKSHWMSIAQAVSHGLTGMHSAFTLAPPD